MKTFLFSSLLLLGCSSLLAADRHFQVATNSAIVNHWPSTDAYIGTADDQVSSNLSKYSKSSPNSYGTYSYIVTSFGAASTPDPFLFGNYDTATFVLGSVTIDPSAGSNPEVPLLKSVEFIGTELFPGHGPYSVRYTAKTAGSPTHQHSLFNFDAVFDFEATFASGPARSTNATAKGMVAVIESNDYTAPNLIGIPQGLADYISSVAIPLAKTQGASAVLCGQMNLNTPASLPGTAGGFPALNTYAVVVALEFAVLPPQFTSVGKSASGNVLTWKSTGNKPVTVQYTTNLANPFKNLAENLSSGQFTDPQGGEPARFYRLATGL